MFLRIFGGPSSYWLLVGVKGRYNPEMDCSQNYGPLLVTDDILRPLIFRVPKWDPNVGHYPYNVFLYSLLTSSKS